MVISIMLILSLLGGYFFFIDHVSCSNASSGAIWTRNAMTEYEPFSYLYLVYWKITKIIRFFVKTWFSELLLPLSSKPSIFKHSKNITVLFLSVFAQIWPTMVGTKAAWSHEISTAREAALCIQRESDHDRKWVLYFQLTVARLQITRPQSRHICYLCTNNPDRRC